jgi:hypothetical protein
MKYTNRTKIYKTRKCISTFLSFSRWKFNNVWKCAQLTSYHSIEKHTYYLILFL